MGTMTNNNTSSTYFNHASKETNLIWSVAFIFVGLLTVVLNFATILIFVINRHLRRRSVYCLINLAVADMLYGVLTTTDEYFQVHNMEKSVGFKIPLNVVFFSSLYSLVPVSLERVYAIFFPFRHRTTRLRMYIIVFAITWLLPLPLVIAFHFSPGISQRISVTSILVIFPLCLTIICTSYTAIFVKVKNQALRLRPNQQQTAAIQIRQKREQHLAMTLFIVTVLSLITWLPYIIVQFLLKLYKSNAIPFNLEELIYLMQRTNSLLNPIIYVLRMRDFRKALSQLFFKCSRDQQCIYPIGHQGNQGNQCRDQEPPIELHVIQER
jgi:hypothetical protein